jgi:transcriptional regulator with XRE-family HTH domain
MIIEAQIARISQRIRQRRKEMGLSVREAARLTRTSPSSIQKIESNEMVPSIAVLMKIAQGFKQNVIHFLEDDFEPQEVALVRQDERETISVRASQLKIEDLGSAIVNSRLEVALLTIEKGGKSGKGPLIHEGEEIKFCLEGEIVYSINDIEYRLQKGDCIHFKSNNPHYWKNVSPGTTRVFSVVFNPLVGQPPRMKPGSS